MNSFMDYIASLEAREIFLVKRAKDIPFLVDFLETTHQFESAKRAKDWYDGINNWVASEFDETCLPVIWEDVKEPPPVHETIAYVESFNKMVSDYVPEEPEGLMVAPIDCDCGAPAGYHFLDCESSI